MKSVAIKKSFVIGGIAAFTYIFISFYLINYQLILGTITGDYSITYKLTLLSSLATGSIQILPAYEVALIGITAVLVGINAAFITKLLKRIRDQGSLRLTTGGTSLLAVAGAGCPSCGISVLSVLGISTSYLPIRGAALQLITIGLLGVSLVYNYRKLHQPEVCKTK